MAETSNVEFEFFGVQIHVTKVLNQDINAMFSLTARSHFVPTEVEIKTS